MASKETPKIKDKKSLLKTTKGVLIVTDFDRQTIFHFEHSEKTGIINIKSLLTVIHLHMTLPAQ